MFYKTNEILQFVKENDVKFIRLAFCDLTGRQRNISIMPGELERAFEKGVAFDASAVTGFENAPGGDLFLVPEASTLSILPWRPSHGRVARFMCSIKDFSGRIFSGDCRALLASAENKARELGYTVKTGAECEFYLFKLDEQGEPTSIPYDQAGYMDVAPLARGENVRREICLTLEDMGIQPESSHHEKGPGQNEIDFKFSDALITADRLITVKWVVSTTAARNGLYASFEPLPLKNAPGSGLHLNLSLFTGGKNIFKTAPDEHCPEAESFMAGILENIGDITAFLNAAPSSYERLRALSGPDYIGWGRSRRDRLIRIPAASGENARLELRSPDSLCNPYLALAMSIFAGLDGIKRGARPKALPESLLPLSPADAAGRARRSSLVKENMPELLLNNYLAHMPGMNTEG